MLKKILKKINIEKTLKILAYIVPIGILLFFIYINLLPFGYSDFQVIEVGKEGDTSGRFYLEESPDLSARQKINNTYFRYLDGTTNAIYRPRVILNNAQIEATIRGENVYFITQPDLNINWDYEWDINNIDDFIVENPDPQSVYQQFLKGTPATKEELSFPFALLFDFEASLKEELSTGDISLVQDPRKISLKFNEQEIVYNVPDYFLGNKQTILVGFNGEYIYFFVNEELVDKKEASEKFFNEITLNKGKVLQYEEGTKIKETIPEKDGCMYFDGNTRLILPDSTDRFEEGPFAVYVEWIPEKIEDRQQLIGHLNWDLYQNENSIHSRFGRTEETNSFHSVSYNIKEDFSNKKHNTLLLYNPTYIALFVNGELAEITETKETLRKDYSRDLSMGHADHSGGTSPLFEGLICNVKFAYTELSLEYSTEMKLIISKNEIKIPITGHGKIEEVEIKVLNK